MSIFYFIKHNFHISVVILLIFINICYSNVKEGEEGLLETLDKLIQQTDAGRVPFNETKPKNDSNVYYLKNNPPKVPKSKSKTSKKKSKSKTKRTPRNSKITTTTIKPPTDNITMNETLNETQDVNKSMENKSQNDTATEGPSSKEQNSNETIISPENSTLTPVTNTEAVSATSQLEKVSARKLLDDGNITFAATTLTPESNKEEIYANNFLVGEEKIDNNLEVELDNRTEVPPPPSNDTSPSDVTIGNQSTLDKPPAAAVHENDNDVIYRKALNMSEPTNKDNNEGLNGSDPTTEKPQTDYSPHYLDTRIENFLHDDPERFIKILSENADNMKKGLTEKEMEKPDVVMDKFGSPELQSEVQRLVKKVLVLKTFSRNHYESDENSNEYDKEPIRSGYRRFPNSPLIQTNPPYSYNNPASNTYYVKDSYVPVPVPVANPVINPVATGPMANNLQVHYSANTLWNNNLAEMSRVHKMAHINHISGLINNIMRGVLYPPLFNSYVYY